MSGRSPRRIAVTRRDIAITLSGTFNSQYAYATINGVKYIGATTVEVAAGTVIDVFVGGTQASAGSVVTLNGVTVQSGRGTYSYKAAVSSALQFSQSSTYDAYCCAITTN